MTTTLSNHGPSARPVNGFEEDPYAGDHPDEARLRGLTRQQLADRLNWLSWYQPGIFAAVMDYGQFSDDLAADTDPVTWNVAENRTGTRKPDVGHQGFEP
jgi:hypothetical protein